MSAASTIHFIYLNFGAAVHAVHMPYYKVIFTLTPIPNAFGPTWLLTLQVNGS